MQLGVDPKLKGFAYMVDAVQIYSIGMSITELCKKISKKRHDSWRNIYRSMCRVIKGSNSDNILDFIVNIQINL